MNNQRGYGEVRVTVQEAAQISMATKQIVLDLWNQLRSSESCQRDFQEIEELIFQLKPPDFRFWAEKSSFWEEQIPKVEDKLRLIGAKELIPIFHHAPAFFMWDLLHNRPDSLVDYLRSFTGEIEVGTCKLSKLQRDILLNLYMQTVGGMLETKWMPTKWLVSQTAADCAAVSRALKRLKERGLIAQPLGKNDKTHRRTTHVKLTHLGFLVSKQIVNSQEANVKQSFSASLREKLRNG